jgi:lipoprotein-anchoring transpeptidase ErfK/SrfK
MTKYEDVISRAVAAMPSDIEGRRATYDRARNAMTDRLRSVDPPLADSVIEAEQNALETAIQRVEMRFGQPAYEPAMAPPAAPHHELGRPRRGLRIAAICCLGIVVALGAGLFSYPYWGTTGRQMYRQLRQEAFQPKERAEPAATADTPSSATVPYVYLRQLVHYRSTNPAGTVVIDKAQRHLYVIMPNVTAIRYGIALGGNCLEATGRFAVSRKIGAPDAPASASNDASGGRVLYLDSDTRLIHGTGAAGSIGQSVKSGCFLLMPPDLAELYGRIPVGTRVLVN